MKWNKYILKISTQAVDIVSGLLVDSGIEGIEVVDKVPLTEEELSQMYVDIPADPGEDDGIAYINFYVENGETEEDIKKEKELIESILEEINSFRDFLDPGEVSIEKSVTEDADWANNWKKYFKPFEVDDILIKPTWETVPVNAKDKMVVNIDPGMAFGTGMHETTQLCIKQIKKYVKTDMKFLDVGCGSGILSIIGVLSGLDKVISVDIDAYAVENAKENFIENNISEEHFTLYAGNILEDEELRTKIGDDCYDMVVANILADVIIPLSSEVVRHLKSGGLFISSGIIDMKEEEVRTALENNPEFEILEVTRKNDWVSFTAKKK